MIYLSTLLLSLFITIALIPAFSRLAIFCRAVDVPNTRKIHCDPMPKAGGIAMAIGMLVPVIFLVHASINIRAILIGSGIVVLAGLIDDFRELSYTPKFVCQIVAALVVIFTGMLIAWFWEGPGALMILAGFLTFAIANRGLPHNVVFIGVLLTGLLFLFLWWRSRIPVQEHGTGGRGEEPPVG